MPPRDALALLVLSMSAPSDPPASFHVLPAGVEVRFSAAWSAWPRRVERIALDGEDAGRSRCLTSLPPGTRTFRDHPEGWGSHLYRFAGPGSLDLVLLRLPGEGLVGLPFDLPRLGDLMAALGPRTTVQDGNTGTRLSPEMAVPAGTVLHLRGGDPSTVSLLGTPPRRWEIHVPAGQLWKFTVPPMTPPLTVGAFRAMGAVRADVSRIFADGNNRQLRDDQRLEPGRVYAVRAERPLTIRFRCPSAGRSLP